MRDNQNLLINQESEKKPEEGKKDLHFKSLADAELKIENMVYMLTGQKIDTEKHSIDEVHYLIAIAFDTIDKLLKAHGLKIEHQKKKDKKLF